MRNTLLLIFTLFFAGQTAYSQYVSENYYNFDNEINEILLQTDKGEINRIICKFKIFVQPNKKKDLKEVIEFEFLNDTIIMALTYWEYKDYWVNRSGKLVNIDYDQENSVVRKDNSPFIDSAGYKVFYTVLNNVTDTTYYYIRKKIDNGGKSVETIYRETSRKLGQETTFYKKDCIGDTCYTNIYQLTSGDRILLYEIKEWKVWANNRVIDAPSITIKYIYETNGNITKSVTTSNSVYLYDSIGRLASVTKFFFLDYDEKWYQKHMMRVKYISR
ncbi:MAG TPA: hypothetical protein PLB46_07270 [Chitinophagales bacterium]|nr:hypothetical protein [Chitinophagales bacterium]